MKLLRYLRRLWSASPDLTTRQLELNRIRLKIHREAKLHDKHLGRTSSTLHFTFSRKDYALLLRAARASHLDITTFFRRAALTEARVVMQLNGPGETKEELNQWPRQT